MDYSETVTLLRNMPLFSTMDPSNLKLLAFSSTLMHLDAGEMLCSEGDPSDGVFVIEDGEVQVYVERDGAEIPIALVGRDSVLGEIAVILNQRRSASLRAASPVKLIRIEAEIFLDLVTREPDAALAVMRTLAARITDMLAKQGKPVMASNP